MNGRKTKVVSLGENLFISLKKHGNKTLQFLDDINETETYADILIKATRTAIKLQSEGVNRDDIIASCLPNERNSWIPFLATQFLGAISTTLDLNLSEEHAIYLLNLTQPKILFVSEESLQFMETCLKKSNVSTKIVVHGKSERYPTINEFLAPSENEKSFYPIEVENEKDTAIILFSSGTTGRPKGICLSHKSLLKYNDFNFIRHYSTIPKDDVLLAFGTLYWISGVGVLLRTIFHGSSVVVVKKFNAVRTWYIIEKYKVTVSFLAPYDSSIWIHHKPNNVDISSLKIFLTGSSSVTKTLMDNLRETLPNVTVLQGYGLTEAVGCITIFRDPLNQVLKPTSCGKVIPPVEFRIVDPNTEEILGPNQRGELRLKADFFMNGYYKLNVSAFDANGYLKTGDIGHYDEDECLFIAGRMNEMFKYRGHHVVPSFIEEIIYKHPSVKEACVFGVPNEADGEHAMAVVTLNDGFQSVTSEDIVAYVNDKVGEPQKLRGGVRIVDEIPKTITGKVKRSTVKELVINNKL